MSEPDVLEGALRIARVEYPDLAEGALRDRLDALADGAPKPAAKNRDGARRLLEHFCGTLGFRGNREDYGDPRNSYLNDVLDRRTGIPISLSWIFVELARRLGFRAHGVGFPGHFLAKLGQGGHALVVDCFNGRALDEEGCLELLASTAPGAPAGRLPQFLASATPRSVLLRMLGNLRRVHEERGDYDRVLAWLELQSGFGDPSAELLRDRGLVSLALGRYARAHELLEAYLRTAEGAADGDAVRSRLALCRKLLAELN